MLNFLSFENRARGGAPVLCFAIFITAQFAGLLAAIRLVFRSTWDEQVGAGAGAIVLTCISCNLLLCFGEYFFHRYLLHLETVRFLRRLYTSHLAHHKVTSIGFDQATATVKSAYVIDRPDRDVHATFPPWALVPFFAFFTPFFAPMAFSFPDVPILIGGYLAIAIAHFLYETLHVLHHQPYDCWWKARIHGRWFGGLWRRMYGFHQAHHANYRCNLNVAGFFGVPLADLVFRTYRQPDTLLLDGAPATNAIARELTPAPGRFIAWLDRVSFKRRRWMAKRP